MKSYIFIPLVFGIILVSGCIQSDVQNKPTLWVYKTNANYNNMMSAVIDDNGEIGLHPSLPCPSCIRIMGGYYYAQGPDSAYVITHTVIINMTLDEWNNWKGTHDSNELINYVLDENPFEEAYFCTDVNAIKSLSVGQVPIACEQIELNV